MKKGNVGFHLERATLGYPLGTLMSSKPAPTPKEPPEGACFHSYADDCSGAIDVQTPYGGVTCFYRTDNPGSFVYQYGLSFRSPKEYPTIRGLEEARLASLEATWKSGVCDIGRTFDEGELTHILSFLLKKNTGLRTLESRVSWLRGKNGKRARANIFRLLAASKHKPIPPLL